LDYTIFKYRKKRFFFRILFCENYSVDSQYERRFIIERTNAWIDGQKALLVRYEKLDVNWVTLHLLAFSLFFLRKIKV